MVPKVKNLCTGCDSHVDDAPFYFFGQSERRTGSLAKLARFAGLCETAPHLAAGVWFSGHEVLEILADVLAPAAAGQASIAVDDAFGDRDAALEAMVSVLGDGGGVDRVQGPVDADLAGFIVESETGPAVLAAGMSASDAEAALVHASQQPVRQVVAGSIAREMARIKGPSGAKSQLSRGEELTPASFSCSGGRLPCVIEDILYRFPSQECFAYTLPCKRRCRAVQAAVLKGTDIGKRALQHAADKHPGAFAVGVTPRWRHEDGTESRPKAWVFAVSVDTTM